MRILNLKEHSRYTKQYLNIIRYMFNSDEIYGDEHFGTKVYDEYGYDYIDWHIQEGLLDKPFFHVWVAVIRGKVVGFAALSLRNELVASIYNVFILPKYRRRGIHTEFKQIMVDKAKAMDCPIITSAVNRWNTASRAMNKKAGWDCIDSRRECGTVYYYKVLV